jgi:hypothetical protein
VSLFMRNVVEVDMILPRLDWLEHPPCLSGGGRSHGRVANGSHGLHKVSIEPAMPIAQPFYALRDGPPLKRPYGLRPSSTPLDTPRCTPYSFHRHDCYRHQVYNYCCEASGQPIFLEILKKTEKILPNAASELKVLF